MNDVVVDDLEERLGAIAVLARRRHPLHHHRRPMAEFRDLVVPLVLEQGRADNQHAADPSRARQDLARRDRLDRLAQTHLVGDQATPRARREQRSPRVPRRGASGARARSLPWSSLAFLQQAGCGRRVNPPARASLPESRGDATSHPYPASRYTFGPPFTRFPGTP